MAKKSTASADAKRKKLTSAKALKAKPKAGQKPAAKSAAKPAQLKKGKRGYSFCGRKAEGKPNMRDLLGGKGAGLAEMANLGLPVPPGFTITTEVCTAYYAGDKTYPKHLERQVVA